MTSSTGTEANRAATAAEPLEPRDPHAMTFMWKSLRTLARIAATLLLDLKVYGVRNVPRDGGLLLVANHQSLLDPILVALPITHRMMSFMAKSQLFENRYFGGFIRALNAFPIRQGAGDVGAMKETIRRLKEGHMLNIFPEGSRTLDGEMGPIEPGAALVIRRAGVPVVPVVIDGTFEAWPKGRKMLRPTRVRMMYGPPMELSHLKPDEITRIIGETLRRMFDELRSKRPRS
jgi:1-acyl-sn-glycerol-3-phosphate acyltransferase